MPTEYFWDMRKQCRPISDANECLGFFTVSLQKSQSIVKYNINYTQNKSSFTQSYIYLFLVMVSGILNVFDSYLGSIKYSFGS